MLAALDFDYVRVLERPVFAVNKLVQAVSSRLFRRHLDVSGGMVAFGNPDWIIVDKDFNDFAGEENLTAVYVNYRVRVQQDRLAVNELVNVVSVDMAHFLQIEESVRSFRDIDSLPVDEDADRMGVLMSRVVCRSTHLVVFLILDFLLGRNPLPYIIPNLLSSQSHS